MRCRKAVIAAVLVMLAATAAFAEELRWSLSSSVNYSKGDYGTTEDTSIWYVPVTLRVTPIDRFILSLTVPYIRQTSQTVNVTGGGVAVRKDKERQLATTPGAVTKTEDGPGDLLLKGLYVFMEEEPWLPEMSSSLKIKFPTADEDKGLGTGEFDYTLGLDVSKTFRERWATFLGIAYTFIGSPPGADFDNSFAWSLGAAYRVAQPMNLFAFLDGATAISAGQDDPLEVRVGVEYRVTPAAKLTGFVTKGLSDGAADWGISVGVVARF